jgi:hypothetical protein
VIRGESLKFIGGKYSRAGCTKAVAGVFGGLFVMAVLIVPCSRTISNEKPDPSGRLVYKTTISKSTYLFLPQYLSARARTEGGSEIVRLKSRQWLAVMTIVAFLGILDYLLFCRILGRSGGGGSSKEDEEPLPPSESSGFSLLQ